MPLSAAEKMRRRREKLKREGKYEDYKKCHREVCKKSRAKKKSMVDSLPESQKKSIKQIERAKIKKRVNKCRLFKNLQMNSQDDAGSHASSFSSPQSLGKATARARKALPKCIAKKKMVLNKLLSESNTTATPATSQLPKQHASALREEVVKKVLEFYQRDDISRQAPGLKDFVIIRSEDKTKEKVQIRHLYTSVSETHALFLKEYGAIVGKSKFAELRPKHVYLSNKLPHNVCLCRYHENYVLALNSLHKITGSPQYDHGFIGSVICDVPTNKCWLYDCNNCKVILKNKLTQYVQACVNLPAEISWYVWKDCEGKLSKVQEIGTVVELMEHILDMTPSFFEHSYVKRCQADSYNKDRLAISSLRHDPTVALLQVDFAENFTCIAQDEVQSFHWVQPQVTLFTASLWFSGEQHPQVIVSDNRQHNKETATIYIDKILGDLPEFINDVHIWSDGPSSQFKNKYIVESLKLLEQRHAKNITWNYFATSHGKGPVDGIGGALKRTVRNIVMRREAIVFNAEQFAEAAKKSSVKVIHVTAQEIIETAKAMSLDTVFCNAPGITGISKSHIIYWDNGQLQMARTSSELNREIKEKRSFYEEVYGAESDSDESDDNVPLALIKQRNVST